MPTLLVLGSWLLHVATAPAGVDAAPKPNRIDNQQEPERHNRGGSKGPRGKSESILNHRRLQVDFMGGQLSDGLGGQGGNFENYVEQPMREQVVPVEPTFTPITNAPTSAMPMSPPPTAPPVTTPPTIDGRNITYLPGMLTVMERDLILSQGLTSKIIALSGRPVLLGDGTTSVEDFHPWPDGAATFVDNRPGNEGGWLYVSNVEDKKGGYVVDKAAWFSFVSVDSPLTL